MIITIKTCYFYYLFFTFINLCRFFQESMFKHRLIQRQLNIDNIIEIYPAFIPWLPAVFNAVGAFKCKRQGTAAVINSTYQTEGLRADYLLISIHFFAKSR
jgi:hypothetical protein